ncbi:MAG: hypothetical protein R3300_17175, partial [Candidatus Promineifilaceae bacterium]|nr:hypothetical protein [Candidatus Promineifilaceae bacterium]
MARWVLVIQRLLLFCLMMLLGAGCADATPQALTSSTVSPTRVTDVPPSTAPATGATAAISAPTATPALEEAPGSATVSATATVDVSAGTWAQGATMPTARSEMAAA